jgi:hypothetical protein
VLVRRVLVRRVLVRHVVVRHVLVRHVLVRRVLVRRVLVLWPISSCGRTRCAHELRSVPDHADAVKSVIS